MNLTESDKRKLRGAFAVRASVNGNLMNFIGLDAVRDRFPETWERNRERILATTRGIIEQHTDPRTDLVLPISDGNFVVLFTRLEKHEALLRAAAIKAELLRRFMGDDVLDTLDMQVEAMELDSDAVMGGTFGDLLGAARSFAADPPLSPEHLDSTDGATAARAGRLYQASLEDLLSHAELPLDDLAKRFEFSFDSLEFGFQPFLYAAKGVFSVFACRAVRYGMTGDILTGYAVLPRDADAAQIATLDKMMLLRVRHGLVDMALRKRVAIVVVPVSFETITDRVLGAEYLGLLQKVPADLRNYLVPAFCRFPVGVPEGRLAEIMNPLKRLTRAVSMHLESARQPLAPIRAAGAFSVSIDLGASTGTETASPGFVERYATAARKLGLHTFVDGVDTPDAAARSRAAKVDYIGGRAFAELSDYIGPVAEMQVA